MAGIEHLAGVNIPEVATAQTRIVFSSLRGRYGWEIAAGMDEVKLGVDVTEHNALSLHFLLATDVSVLISVRVYSPTQQCDSW